MHSDEPSKHRTLQISQFIVRCLIALVALVFVLMIVAGAGHVFGQDNEIKPKDTDPPDKAIAFLKVDRQISQINLLAVQIQSMQVEFDRRREALTVLIKEMHKTYGLSEEEWTFDLQKMTFVRKSNAQSKVEGGQSVVQPR